MHGSTSVSMMAATRHLCDSIQGQMLQMYAAGVSNHTSNVSVLDQLLEQLIFPAAQGEKSSSCWQAKVRAHTSRCGLHMEVAPG